MYNNDKLRVLFAGVVSLGLALAYQPIQPNSLLVGVVVDMRSENITRDALLMLRSLRLFGNASANVDIVATLVHSNFSELENYDQLAQQFKDLNVQSVLHAPALAPFQQTCNKLFAFESFIIYGKRKHQWFLYLDADIFVLEDFLQGLEPWFDGLAAPAPELLCFPSWDYYMGWPASEYYNTLLSEAFNPPANWSIEHPVAHCNTGVMFMTARVTRDLWMETHRILYNELLPWIKNAQFVDVMTRFSHVDSWALAVAAQRLDLTVGALSVEWNYLAAAELYILAHVGIPSESRKIKLLHFLAETSLTLTATPDCAGRCSGLLKLRNATDTSPSLHALQPFIQDGPTCMKLVGCGRV